MGKNLFFWFVTSQSNQTEPLYLHPRFKVRTFVSQSRRLNYLPQPATLRRNATRPRYRYQSRSFYRYLSRSPTHSMVIEGPTPALDERRSRSFVVAWLLRGAWTFPSQRRRQDALARPVRLESNRQHCMSRARRSRGCIESQGSRSKR